MDTTLRADVAAHSALFSVGPHVPTVRDRAIAEEFELSWARASDHAQIHRLLLTAFQEPTRAEFQALNEALRYDPADRLIIRRGDEIAAHVQLVQRRVHFDGLELPTMDLKHLATLPEYRSLGLARQLHDAAMDEVRRAGILLATVSARHPNFFASMGWFRCGRYSYSEVEPRSLIATLPVPPAQVNSFLRSPETPLSISVWRRNELDALTSLYEQVASRSFGRIQRLDSDWQWLIRRGAFDYIYLVRESATRGGQCPIDSPATGNAVGYAIVRDGNILELVAAPDHNQRRVIEALMARVCRDALENGRGLVRVHAAPDHPVHAMIEHAHGDVQWTERAGGRVAMAQVTQPASLLLATPSLAQGPSGIPAGNSTRRNQLANR